MQEHNICFLPFAPRLRQGYAGQAECIGTYMKIRMKRVTLFSSNGVWARVPSKLKLSVITLLFLTCSIHAYDFGSLQSITAYTQHMPELVHNDNDDPYNPSFEAFNGSHAVTYFDRLLHLFGLRTIVDIDDFITTMRHVTQERELNGYFGKVIEKQHITSATRWFVCGSLYGALHAQVSILHYLQKQHIINDELELIQADTYLVFTDTIRAYTPYGLESLWIMLKLMAKNPGKVMLIKTTDWPLDAGKNSLLVDTFYNRFNRPRLMLKQLLDAFVNTLPDALYLIADDDSNIIKITAGVELSDASWQYFFKEKVSGVFRVTSITQSDGPIPLKSIVDIHPLIPRDQKRVPTLTFSSAAGVDVWSLISCSVEPFTTDAHIHQDAFIEIATEKHFAHWKLMLYGQSIHERTGFKLLRSYDLSSGALSYSSDVKEHIKVLEQQVAAAQQEVDTARDTCEVGDGESKK